MKRSLTLTIFILLIVIDIGFSQTLSPKVISTSGSFYNNSQGSLSVTIGESSSVNTVSNTLINLIFTQGFQQNESLTVLPVKLIDLTAERINEIVKVSWQVTNESSIVSYTLQRSLDGINFNNIGNVTASNGGSILNKYTFVDAKPLLGKAYYRILITEANGNKRYSWIIELNNTGSHYKVYPMPVYDKAFIEISVPQKISKDLRMYDLLGRIVWNKIIILNVGKNIITIDLTNQAVGTYILKGINNEGIKILKTKN